MVSLNLTRQPTKVALISLLLATLPLASSIQVTPNSPCAPQCIDSSDVDRSDPNSSNTRNSDIVCMDADMGSPAGKKWQSCMTCLQTSPFSQGAESDQGWFLFNMRYALSYCIFAFNNATGVHDSPCKTSFGCEPLQSSFALDVLQPSKAPAYDYCSFNGSVAMSHPEYERCEQCVMSERKTMSQVNYLVALEAGCQQQPKPGKILGLNDTVFSSARITIVDPLTIVDPAPPSSGLATTTIIGIVVAGLAAVIIAAAVTFVCYRKRKNRRTRADAEAKYYARHESNLSFQCQTHMTSPRFWPGGAEGPPLSAVDESGEAEQKFHYPSRQSSLRKPTDSTENVSWDSPYQLPTRTSQVPRGGSNQQSNNSAVSLPLHQITTSVPAAPPNVYTSPSSAANHSPSDGGAVSAVSARSTTGLLANFKPYVPAEHGIHSGAAHGSPQSVGASTFSSPVSGTGATPLLKQQTWQQDQNQRQLQQQPPKNTQTTAPVASDVPPPPPPPAPKAPRIAMPKKPVKKATMPGTPIESTQIKTAFSAPPKK